MTILTIIFIVFAIVFLVLFCVSNQVATKEAAELKRYKLIAEREKQNHYTAFAKCQSVIEEKNEAIRELSYTKEDLKRAEAELKELRDKMGERAKLCGIKFTANIPLTGWTKTEFKLGVGPCGKEVISIQLIEKPDHYIVTQWCTDGERKEFEYKKEDVAGRIERAYRPYKKQ
ncbi:unknown function [Klebsiella phage vB_Kpn_K12P1.1]|uniref:Fusion protein n=1 Tax=Klebsiella phage vB_Kpn_K12P1.1 TaxID=3071627 RepID=A0AAV1ME54_9CAUD|nr:unknown function [Klebsiella phage vB_Kpn_K12P1.1]